MVMSEMTDCEAFPVGSRVRIRRCVEDFVYFGDGTDTGTVVRNSRSYLGIIVRFDRPRHYKDGSVMTEFNFRPQNLELLTPNYLAAEFAAGLDE